ncbi:phage head closure protein [Rhodovulum sulfidophilum]|uniref:phage head closure protein n=1 Tax=Rhodovulum sulfidophilum TaxID=35806 RepID=UPI00308347D1
MATGMSVAANVRAERFRDRITIQRQGAEDDGHGNVVSEFEDLLSLWADMREATGKEKISSGVVEASRMATIRIRFSSAARGITAADRVVARGQTWNIRSIARIGRVGEILEMLCETGVAT